MAVFSIRGFLRKTGLSGSEDRSLPTTLQNNASLSGRLHGFGMFGLKNAEGYITDMHHLHHLDTHKKRGST